MNTENDVLSSNICFLLGSGISIPAGYPSVTDITNKILSGNNIFHHTDSNYYFGESNPLSDDYVKRVVDLINFIKKEIDPFYQANKGRDSNYEEIYYVLYQLQTNINLEFENPLAEVFINQLSSKIKPFLQGGMPGRTWKLSDLLNEATNYIQCVVWHMINRNPSQTNYLSGLIDSITNVPKADVFTLNLDLLMENVLTANKISYNDGFGTPIKDIRYFERTLLKRNIDKIKLYKLHGSNNWIKFISNDGLLEKTGILVNQSDIWHTKDKNGNLQHPAYGFPTMLTGTFNKILAYSSDIFISIYSEFINSLYSSNTLVICGYGFGDKGINTSIFEWVHSNKNNKIVIVHGNTKNLQSNARNVLIINWNDLTKKAKLKVLPVYVEKLTWNDLSKVL